MARATLLPVNLNASSLTGGSWLTSTTAGYDSGSPGGTITAWAAEGGVQFVNNGQLLLAVANGATTCNAYILTGRKAGGGYMPPYTTYTVAIGASYSGWLGPFSVQDFQQADDTQYASAPGGTVSAGYTVVDFDVTTTLALRLYQLIPAIP